MQASALDIQECQLILMGWSWHQGWVHRLLQHLFSAHHALYRMSEVCDVCLQDACSAVAIGPTWAKSHWRKGAALKGLKRFPEAVQAFYQASIILKGKHEGERFSHRFILGVNCSPLRQQR